MLMTILLCIWACLAGLLPLSMLISRSVIFFSRLSSSMLGKIKLLNSKSLLLYRSSGCSESELGRQTLSCPTLENWLFLNLFAYMELLFLSQPISVPLRIELQESEYQKKRNLKQNTQKKNLCPLYGQISRSLKVFKVKEIYRYRYMDR